MEIPYAPKYFIIIIITMVPPACPWPFCAGGPGAGAGALQGQDRLPRPASGARPSTAQDAGDAPPNTAPSSSLRGQKPKIRKT